ncbi:hypothetical protein CVS40_7994 [Lucilia cuprina]|nr:hypothetical protein CVS40_7994 [Lucilia cuprina]
MGELRSLESKDKLEMALCIKSSISKSSLEPDRPDEATLTTDKYLPSLLGLFCSRNSERYEVNSTKVMVESLLVGTFNLTANSSIPSVKSCELWLLQQDCDDLRCSAVVVAAAVVATAEVFHFYFRGGSGAVSVSLSESDSCRRLIFMEFESRLENLEDCPNKCGIFLFDMLEITSTVCCFNIEAGGGKFTCKCPANRSCVAGGATLLTAANWSVTEVVREVGAFLRLSTSAILLLNSNSKGSNFENKSPPSSKGSLFLRVGEKGSVSRGNITGSASLAAAVVTATGSRGG